MGSERLTKGIALAADILAMRGSVSKRQVAEEAIKSCRPDTWAESERHEAYTLYAMKKAHAHFITSVNGEINPAVLEAIPRKYRRDFSSMPRMICISTTGGPNAQYVHSLLATPEDWQKNFELKDFVAQKAWSGRNISRDIRNLLMERNVMCLADLAKHAA